jgi:hypothetical protein
MKKLSLKSLDFTSNERLQKEQLKAVFGGYGGYSGAGSCTIMCKDDTMFYDTGCSNGNTLCHNHGGFSSCDCDNLACCHTGSSSCAGYICKEK